jgi:hypothetical protein
MGDRRVGPQACGESLTRMLRSAGRADAGGDLEGGGVPVVRPPEGPPAHCGSRTRADA